MRTEKKVITEASVSRAECAASATRLRLPVTTPAASFAAAKSSDTTTETQVTRAFSRRSALCPKNVSCTPRNLPRGRQECAGPRWRVLDDVKAWTAAYAGAFTLRASFYAPRE